MKSSIYSDYLDKWTQDTPDDVWLRDRAGDRITEWTWRQARARDRRGRSMAEERYGSGVKMAVLSRNRARAKEVRAHSLERLIICLTSTPLDRDRLFGLRWRKADILTLQRHSLTRRDVGSGASGWPLILPICMAQGRTISLTGYRASW